MDFYYSIFCILALFSTVELFGLNRKVQFLLFGFIIIGFFLLSFLRWEIGTDWDAYYGFFENLSDINDSDFEWGYSVLSYLVKVVFGNFSILLFFCGLIIYFLLSKTVYKLSVYPITSLFFLWSINFGFAFFVRQTISVAILLYSLQYITNRKFPPFLICIFVATLFHRSSIIFIFAWWVYKINIKTIWIIVFVSLSVLLTPVVKTLMESSMSMFGNVIESKLDSYIGGGADETFGMEISISEIIIKGALSKGLLLVVLLFYRNEISKEYKNFNGLLNIYWFGIVLYFSMIGISLAMVRFSYYYDMIQIIIFPVIFKYIGKRFKLMVIVLFSLYLASRLYSTINAYYDLYIPFKTILFL